jgi:Ni,Fe-hydrogenase III large subunit
MTRTPWRAVSRTAPGPAGESARAYLPDDHSFELRNDYERGVAILLTPGSPSPEEIEGPASVGRPIDRPTPIGPVSVVEGYGVFTFPYGPISMGVPEAGRFDVRTYGERILSLTPVAGYKSRGIRESVVGRSVEDAALAIERMAGNFSAAHVAAFLGAAESAEEIAVPAPEASVRAVGQELQRVYNHLHVLARVAEAASQNVGLAQTHALAEEVLRLQGRVFGHRWLFGAFLPHGPARRLDRDDRRRLGEDLHALSEEFERLWSLFLESRTFVDRIQSTCTVLREDAVRAGAVGPTLRACGVPWDDRLRVPTAPYHDLFVALPHESGGDALARVVVRAEEVRSGFLLLEQMLERWPASIATLESTDGRVADHRALARVEAPSGDLVYDVTVQDGKIAQLGFRSPSQANWPVFAAGMRDAVFTDFHFAFESFGLVFAETDG